MVTLETDQLQYSDKIAALRSNTFSGPYENIGSALRGQWVAV